MAINVFKTVAYSIYIPIAKVECEGHPLVKFVAKPNVSPKKSP
jgi:hypothetical protein